MKQKTQTEWDLGLFYKSDNDPNIEKDISAAIKIVDNFAKKYSNKKFLKNSTSLLKALNDYEETFEAPEIQRPGIYLFLRGNIDSNNKKVISERNRIDQIYNKNANKILFFKLELGKISKAQQVKFLRDPKLKKYKYFLEKVFDKSKYRLSESEEKIMNLMSQPAGSMWTSGFSKVLNKQKIEFKGKKYFVSEINSIIEKSNKSDRKILFKKFMEKMVDISDFAESELNAIILKKKISDELRGFEKPYSSVIKSYNNEDKTVEDLVNSVSENMKISHRFYKLKAKLLKLKKIGYEDRAAKIGNTQKKFTFNETIKILQESFEKIDPKYKDILDSFLKNGQIDVLPKEGKKSGAFCLGSYGLPTFVLLNHTNDFGSVNTFAHEMGHAFHSEMTKTQDPIYGSYSIASAEVASTFFENFVFDEVFEKLSDKEKIVALHDRINSKISTVFRQVACFNFENEMHTIAREKGYIAKEEIAEIMNKNMKSYMGPVSDFRKEDGYFFVCWPHIRRNFYVYSYAFGSLVSDALYSEYKKDPKFIKKVEEFLKAGNSKSPENIFGDIGIKLNKNFFEKGLKLIEEDIKRLEKLVKGK